MATQTVPTPISIGQSLAFNRLLAALELDAPTDAAWLWDNLTIVELELGQILAPADAPFTAVYFPLTAVMSVISRMEDGGAAEVGTVGNEGPSA